MLTLSHLLLRGLQSSPPSHALHAVLGLYALQQLKLQDSAALRNSEVCFPSPLGTPLQSSPQSRFIGEPQLAE